MYRIEGTERERVATNGVELDVHHAGPTGGPAIVLSHGFPEIAFSWRDQIGPLAEAGYHVIAPDQRGYAGSSRPHPIDAYGIEDLCDDLLGLLDHWGHERAVLAGHDWGGLVVWQLALLRSERVAGVIGVNTPFFPRAPARPTELLRMIAGEDNYIVQFQDEGVAEGVFDEHVAGVFRALMRSGLRPEELLAGRDEGMTMLDVVQQPPAAGEPLLDDAELAVYVDAFANSGFRGPVNWYRNMDANWEHTADLEGAVPGQPALMVCAEWDPVLTPAMAEPMRDLLDDVEVHTIAACGHWTQSEKPGELNDLMLDWLRRRHPA